MAHEPENPGLAVSFTTHQSMREAHKALTEALGSMLANSGGDSGRDFTPREGEVWKALLEARYQVDLAEAIVSVMD